MTGLRRIVAVVAALTLVLVAGTASANEISLTGNTFRFVWSPLKMDVSGSPVDVECSVTLAGSFHAGTISKVRGTQIGNVTSAPTPTGCLQGTFVFLQLPWRILYEGFAGALPNISSFTVEFIGAGIRYDEPGVGPLCLGATTTSVVLSADLALSGGRVVSARMDEADPISLSEGFGCGPQVRFIGTGTS